MQLSSAAGLNNFVSTSKHARKLSVREMSVGPSFSNYDGDGNGNENVKKAAIGLLSKTTSYLGVAPNRVMQTCLFCRKCAIGTQYVLR